MELFVQLGDHIVKKAVSVQLLDEGI